MLGIAEVDGLFVASAEAAVAEDRGTFLLASFIPFMIKWVLQNLSVSPFSRILIAFVQRFAKSFFAETEQINAIHSSAKVSDSLVSCDVGIAHREQRGR